MTVNGIAYLLLAQRCHFAGVAYETNTNTNGVADSSPPSERSDNCNVKQRRKKALPQHEQYAVTACVPESACPTVQSSIPQVEEMICKVWLEL